MSYFKAINGKLVAPPKNFKNIDGSIICNFNLNEVKLIENGYRNYTDEEVQEFLEANQEETNDESNNIQSYSFSKLKVKEKLVELNIWSSLKESLTEDEYEDLLLAKDLAFDNPIFVKFYNQLKLTIPDIDEILMDCI